MKRAGLIKKFVPVLSPDSINRGVLALVTIRVEAASAERVANDLAKLTQTERVYITTGEHIITTVALDDVKDIQPFLKRNLLARRGVELVGSQIITSIVKEEQQPSLRATTLTMNLKCDYCHGEVTSRRPYTISVGASHYYFCCKTCRREYLEKHGAKLTKLSGRKRTEL